jgi:uncharacterized membrane protein YkoI
MKIKMIVCFATVAALLAGCVTEKCEKCEQSGHHEKQTKWQAKAKVSKADAEKAAMAKVPDGTIKEAELEKEGGKLIWSFDMATPGTQEITEVHVDAKTGAVIAVSKESPEQENKEATHENDDD